MSVQKISALQGCLPGGLLDNGDNFGRSMASIGDLNGDGVSDMAVGAYGGDDGGADRGAVYVVFMNGDGTAMPTVMPTVIHTKHPTEIPTANPTTAIPTTAVPTTTVPTAIPTTAVPTMVPTTPPFLYSCTDTNSFSMPVQPVNDACYPVIYVVGYDNQENACFHKYDNASMASGATIQVPFSGADNCSSMKMDEKHSLNVFISYDGCRSWNHANDITCELNTLVEESAELQAPDFIHIKDNKQKSYDADIEVLSDLHGVSFTVNDTVLDGAALYLNVTLSVDANSTAVLDFISVVLNPKYERLNGPLTLYSDNTIQDPSAAIIQNHGREISFKIEASFFYTAVTLRMLVSFANDTTSRRLFEIQRTLEEEEKPADAVVLVPQVLKIGHGKIGYDMDKIGDSSTIGIGVMGGVLFGVLFLIGGAILFLQIRGSNSGCKRTATNKATYMRLDVEDTYEIGAERTIESTENVA